MQTKYSVNSFAIQLRIGDWQGITEIECEGRILLRRHNTMIQLSEDAAIKYGTFVGLAILSTLPKDESEHLAYLSNFDVTG